MLNIAKKIYVGYRAVTGLQEVEIIPQGDSANEKRKIASFTNRWATIKEFDNIPLPGFTLQKSSKRSWSSTEISWLVIDPRGFVVRISSQNLEEILRVTGVTECLIQQRCVWAREDSQTQMTLVPVTAEEYEVAVKNTKLIEEKVSIADVQIGDKVMLQNESIGTYLGSLSSYGRIEADDLEKTILKVKPKLRRQIVEVEPGRYQVQVDLKILKIMEKTLSPMTKEEAASRINAEIQSQNAIFISHDKFPSSQQSIQSTINSYRGAVKYVSANAIPKPVLSFKKITLDEAEKLFDMCGNDRDASIILGKNGKFCIPDLPYYNSAASSKCFYVLDLIDFDPTKSVTTISTEGHRYGRSIYRNGDSRTPKSLDNFTEFYIITKHVKNNTYI